MKYYNTVGITQFSWLDPIGLFYHAPSHIYNKWVWLVGFVVLYIYKKQNIFSEKKKGFRDGLSYSTPQKIKETRENAITQPRSHPIKKM